MATSILDLPNEISMYIFSLLSGNCKDLIRVIGVCRAWRSFGADPLMWKGVEALDEQAVFLAAHPFACFERLCLFSESDTRSLAATLANDARRRDRIVRTVKSISSFTSDDPNVEVIRPLMDIFAGSLCLTTMETFGNCQELPSLPNLVRLAIMNFDISLQDIVNKWPKLVELELWGSSFQASQIQCKNMPFRAIGCSGIDADLLKSVVAACPALETINLKRNQQIHDVFRDTRTDFLHGQLRTLYVSSNSHDCLYALIKYTWPRLENLSLGDSSCSLAPLDDNLVTLLRRAPRLTRLKLCGQVHVGSASASTTIVTDAILGMRAHAQHLQTIAIHAGGIGGGNMTLLELVVETCELVLGPSPVATNATGGTLDWRAFWQPYTDACGYKNGNAMGADGRRCLNLKSTMFVGHWDGWRVTVRVYLWWSSLKNELNANVDLTFSRCTWPRELP